MTTGIDIRGIDKLKLLRALWQSAPGNLATGCNTEFDENKALDVIKHKIDYFCGRCLKIDISGDTVGPRLFNRNAGPNAFENILKKIKSKKFTKPTNKVWICANGKHFKAYDEPIIGNNDRTIICANCGYFKKQHREKYDILVKPKRIHSEKKRVCTKISNSSTKKKRFENI